MKFAIACLLGLVAAGVNDTTKVWELRSVKDEKENTKEIKAYADASIDAANKRPPYRSSLDKQTPVKKSLV